MAARKNNIWIWVLIVAGLYFLYTKFFKKTGSGSGIAVQTMGGTSTTSVDPASIVMAPPPGYSGPINGPFTWGGVGQPPNGEYTHPGIPITQFNSSGQYIS